MLLTYHVGGNSKNVSKSNKLTSMTVTLMVIIEMLACIIQREPSAIGIKELVNIQILYYNCVVMTYQKKHV